MEKHLRPKETPTKRILADLVFCNKTITLHAYLYTPIPLQNEEGLVNQPKKNITN